MRYTYTALGHNTHFVLYGKSILKRGIDIVNILRVYVIEIDDG